MTLTLRVLRLLPLAGWLLGGALLTHAALAAPASAGLQLPAGARVGVLNLLDAEVTHFHAARQLQESFLKTYPVGWPVNVMLNQAVGAPLTQAGLTPVPLLATDSLLRLREHCLLNANLGKGLTKECATAFAQLGAEQHVDALVILGPGLNDGNHAGGQRRRDLPEYLRGWCAITGLSTAPANSLLNLSELLLIALTPKGASLAQRQWGGGSIVPWAGFAGTANLRALSEQDLDPLQPLFAELLKQQAGALLAGLSVTR